MSRLDWGSEFRNYIRGLDRGVIYFPDQEAVVWDGLVSVQETPALEVTPTYFEGITRSLQQDISDYEAVVESYVFPYILEDAIFVFQDARTLGGSLVEDRPFNMSYRTMTADGYEIHLVYNVVATIDSLDHTTLSDDSDLTPFSFTLYGTAVDIPNARHSSHLILRTSEIAEELIPLVEDVLYGSDRFQPTFPTPEELIAILGSGS